MVTGITKQETCLFGHGKDSFDVSMLVVVAVHGSGQPIFKPRSSP